MVGAAESASELILRLALTPGVGPVMGRRLLAHFGSPQAVLGATAAQLAMVRGVAETRAERIARGMATTADAAQRELDAAHQGNARAVTIADSDYPELLAPIDDAPLVLWVRGALSNPDISARYAVSIVGSRQCTPYGLEQAERFSATLAQAGLAIVSGGARGIDTAAHRAAIRVRGRTIVVSGCGLSRCYPPENAELFQRIVDAGGAIVSELPMDTAPSPENFPARNRIISGMSLGVVVIEAPDGSGALITARVAGESQGREVMAVPGRVDSDASAGSNKLIRDGGAALVMSADDVLEILREPARHQFRGTHAVRFGQPSDTPPAPIAPPPTPRPTPDAAVSALSETQRRLWESLAEPATLDELTQRTGYEAGRVMADATVLEMKRLVAREGSRLVRR